jgi:hypothetical protein
MKKKVVSTEITVHQAHELILKLEKAGLTPEIVQRVIQSSGNRFAKEIVELVWLFERFEIWKTIKMGGLQDKDNICKKIKNETRQITCFASELLDEVPLMAGESRISLLIFSVAELGFKERANYREICDRAKSLGLKLCPAEVGPQLWRQHEEHLGGRIYIGMCPLEDTYNSYSPVIFEVERRIDGWWLYTVHASFNNYFSEDCRFVFTTPVNMAP